MISTPRFSEVENLTLKLFTTKGISGARSSRHHGRQFMHVVNFPVLGQALDSLVLGVILGEFANP